MKIRIYHNPACSTSRNVLALMRQIGVEPEIIDYLKTPPSRAELVDIVARIQGGVRVVLREKAPPYAELGLSDPTIDEDRLIDAIIAHPILMNRPIVITERGARLCRPVETVWDVMPLQK